MKKDIQVALGSVLFGALAFAGVMAFFNYLNQTPFSLAEFTFNAIGFGLVMTVISFFKIRKQRKQAKDNHTKD